MQNTLEFLKAEVFEANAGIARGLLDAELDLPWPVGNLERPEVLRSERPGFEGAGAQLQRLLREVLFRKRNAETGAAALGPELHGQEVSGELVRVGAQFQRLV